MKPTDLPAVWHCPRCSAQLAIEGEATLPDGERLAVFQCEACVIHKQIFDEGEFFDLPYTFAVNRAGRIVADHS
jgi:hypothetical protein